MKVCFVGSGSIGRRHIRNFTAICEESIGSPEIHLFRATQKALPTDIRDFVSKEIYEIGTLDDYYDAVFIVNPTHLHRRTIELLKYHSKVFFVEKPVFDCIDIDVHDMELPKENKYYVACPLRYVSVLSEARKLANLEKIYSIRAISSSYLPDWRKDTDYRTTYSARKEEGGGVRIDLIHEMDYIIDIFGFPSACKEIHGHFSDLEITSDDLVAYLLGYEDKIAEIHLDYFGRVPIRYFEVYTRNDVWKFDIIESTIIRNGQIETEFDEHENDKYLAEMRYFIDLMHSDKDSANSLQHSLDVLKVALGEKSEI